jgi:hypothetical protein
VVWSEYSAAVSPTYFGIEWHHDITQVRHGDSGVVAVHRRCRCASPVSLTAYHAESAAVVREANLRCGAGLALAVGATVSSHVGVGWGRVTLWT